MGHGRYASKMPATVRFPSLLLMHIGVIVILWKKLNKSAR